MSEEKEPKPKKLFQITITVWDDLETDAEMYEFRSTPSKRGPPKKWLLNKSDFVKRVGEVAGDYNLLLEEWNEAIGKGVKENVPFGSKLEVKPATKSESSDDNLEDKDDESGENFTTDGLDFDPEK